MRVLDQVYAKFAVENANLWSAPLAHWLPEGEEATEWHRAEFVGLILQVISPLSELRPDLDQEILQLRAQTLFAVVHGVVQLSIHGFDVGAPPEQLFSEVDAFLSALMRGMDMRS